MLLCLRSVLVTFVMALAVSGTTARAAIVFTNDFKADFRFTVVDGPLAGLGVGNVLDFDARGPLTFTIDDSIPNATTMNFTNVTGTLTVIGPAGFAGSTLTPNLQFVGGQLTSIVRGPGGVVTSGNVTDLRMRWEMFSGPTRLYTRDSLPFDGTISSLPFTSSNFLAGPANFDVFLDAGLGAADPLAVIGSNRFLTVVPEPSSLALLTLGGLGCSWMRRRNRKSAI